MGLAAGAFTTGTEGNSFSPHMQTDGEHSELAHVFVHHSSVAPPASPPTAGSGRLLSCAKAILAHLTAGARAKLGLPLGGARHRAAVLLLIAGGPFVFPTAPHRFRLALLALPARGPQAKLFPIAALVAIQLKTVLGVSHCKLKVVVVTVRQCKHPERGMPTIASHVERNFLPWCHASLAGAILAWCHPCRRSMRFRLRRKRDSRHGAQQAQHGQERRGCDSRQPVKGS
eukprot:scaffold44653_cov61-Phaeocystis_antarctica.AAC.2